MTGGGEIKEEDSGSLWTFWLLPKVSAIEVSRGGTRGIDAGWRRHCAWAVVDCVACGGAGSAAPPSLCAGFGVARMSVGVAASSSRPACAAAVHYRWICGSAGLAASRPARACGGVGSAAHPSVDDVKDIQPTEYETSQVKKCFRKVDAGRESSRGVDNAKDIQPTE